ncbi:uncharacterized protein ISCGN_016625 [Ixodes scapularis]
MLSDSAGAASAAQPGRGDSNASASADYKIILPPLPNCLAVLTTAFLHTNVRGRRYRVEDFRDILSHLELFPEVIALGAYQKNHVRLVTFKLLEGKRRVLAAGDLVVKGRRCIVIDPGCRDVRIKLHWLVFHVLDDEPGLGLDDLPHQLRVAGGLVLVVVPGRAPLCLRCQRTGNYCREYRVPKYDACNRFGRDADFCVKTRAAATGSGGGDAKAEIAMDEVDAEAAIEKAFPATETLDGVAKNEAVLYFQAMGNCVHDVAFEPFKLPPSDACSVGHVLSSARDVGICETSATVRTALTYVTPSQSTSTSTTPLGAIKHWNGLHGASGKLQELWCTQ